MVPTKRQVIAALTFLSPDDRGTVINWCDALGVDNLTHQDNEAAMHAYSELSALFSSYYQITPVSFSQFVRTRTSDYRKLVRATATAERMITSWWPHVRKAQRLALLRYLCKVAFDVCTHRARRTSWPFVIAALRDIEVSVNEAFPGWLRAGIFQQRALERVTAGRPHHVRHQPATQAGFELGEAQHPKDLLHHPR